MENLGSGNRATDYQPQTRNPQADVQGGLQPSPTAPGFLSAPGGFNQQSIPRNSGSLKVETSDTSQELTASTAPARTTNVNSPKSFFGVWTIITGVVIGLVIWALWEWGLPRLRRKRAPEPISAAVPTVESAPKTQSAKKASSKSKAKKGSKRRSKS